MQRYELADGTSNKFWEIGLDGKTVTVRFGRIGTTGQTQVKTHASPEAARKERDKLVAEKTKKGYRLAAARGPAAAKAGAKASAKTKAKAKLVPLLADGAPKDVVALRKLAAQAREGDEAMTRTYIITVTKGKPGVMRAGGPPIGVTDKTRPKYDGAFMHHLITLDLDAMPELRKQHKPLARARALALFISNAMDNEAFDDDTQETAVLALAPKDIARGEWTGPAVGDPKPHALAAWPVDVPARVFTFDRYATDDDADDTDDPMAELHDELMSACRAGGQVIHWSGDDPDDRWVFQFNEDLVEVNLGDAGTMYVFTDRAYWDGH
ncbi:MAG TPA: WGR domain-containing protein [Kofleriaceae bacterium]|nr:WGR domain-containing protein [Kofleriaceae bacterium]